MDPRVFGYQKWAPLCRYPKRIWSKWRLKNDTICHSESKEQEIWKFQKGWKNERWIQKIIEVTSFSSRYNTMIRYVSSIVLMMLLHAPWFMLMKINIVSILGGVSCNFFFMYNVLFMLIYFWWCQKREKFEWYFFV